MESKTKKEKISGSAILRKALCFFMAVLMLFSTFGSAMSVFAMQEKTVVMSGSCGAEEDSVTYVLYSDGVFVISGEGRIENECGDPFDWNSAEYAVTITDVYIEDGITEIDEMTFSQCRNIKNITIGASVNKVESFAFSSCQKLTDVYYAGTEEQWNGIEIGSYNDGLLNANIHFNSTDNGNVTDGNVSDDNVTDGNVSDDNVTDGNIADRTVIDSGSCGDNVTYTLYNDGELVISGEGNMWDYTDCETPFDENINNIKSIVFSDGVTSVGGEAFNNFDNLVNIEFSDTVKTIGYSAFDHCDGIESVMIPSSVTSMDYCVFSGCSKLKSIIVDEKNNYYSNDDFGVLFNKNKTHLIQCPNGFDENEYVIPDGVTSIGTYAFNWCDNIKSIVIPTGITSISNAFEYCAALSDVHFCGTDEQWDYIDIDQSNTALLNANIHFNSTGNGNVTDGDVSEINILLLGTEKEVKLYTSDIETELYFTPETTGTYRFNFTGTPMFIYIVDCYHCGIWDDSEELVVDLEGGKTYSILLSNADEQTEKTVTIEVNKYSVSEENITDGNVTDGDVSDDNVTDGNVSDGNVTDGNVTDGNVTDKYITLVPGETLGITKTERNYSFTPEKSGIYTLSSDSDGDPYCRLYDANMNELYYADDNDDELDFELSYYLEAGKEYYFYVGYYNYNSYCDITLTLSDVASISFTPVQEYILTEGFSSGYYATRWVYDEETEEEYKETYYRFDLPSYAEGDIITVNKSDGTSVVYFYDILSEAFVSEEGIMIKPGRTHEQYTHPWVADGEYNYFTVEYSGATCTVPVTIKANPVKSISFTPVQEYVLTEGVSDGYYTTRWVYDEETDEEYREEYYYYYLPSYNEGDTVTVTYTDGTETDYVWDDEMYDFVSKDGAILNVDKIDNQEDIVWAVDGKYNYFTVEYVGRTCTVPVTIKANPVKSISFTPVQEYVLTEGVSNGYYTTRWVYDEETDEEYTEEYYYYYLPSYNEGDTVTVIYTDGTETEYVWNDNMNYFVSEDDVILNVDRTDSQDDYPWVVDGEYNHFTVKYAGKTCTVPITIKANPVKSISFTPSEEYVLTEGVSDGFYDTRWVYDEETDEGYEEEYYYYYLPSYNEGDTVTVTYTDGTGTEYVWNDEMYNNFVSEDGVILNVDRTNSQDDYPWVVDGEYNYFTVKYAGKTCTVPVTIKANPVKSISFTPVEEYVLTEGVSDGYYDEGTVGEEYYYYYLPSCSDGDTVTVTYTDGTETEYVWDDEMYAFVSKDGTTIRVNRGHNQSNNHWVVDGEYNYFTVKYANKTCTVPVAIRENPVESISAEYKYTLYSGYDCVLGDWDSDRYIVEDYIDCTVKMKDGTVVNGSVDEIEELLNADIYYWVDLEKIGDNIGYIELGSIKGEFTVIVAEKPADTDKQPRCNVNTLWLYFTVGEEIDMQLVEFADKGYTHKIDVFEIPEGLTLSNDGRLTGVINKKSSYMNLDFAVRWENTYANAVYSLSINTVEADEKTVIPQEVETIPYETNIDVEATESEPKWFKFRACDNYCWINFGKEDNCYKSVKLFDSNGRMIDCDGFGDNAFGLVGLYYVTRGEYYYLRVTDDRTIRVNVPVWMPLWSDDGNVPDKTKTELISTNVEKVFDGDENTLWNIYRIDVNYDLDFEGGFIYYTFGSMTRIASPVNIHMITNTTSENDIIHSVNYKYDPNDPEDCEKYYITEAQDTMKDELLEGEKEYRFDNVYYLMPEVGNLVLSEERFLYVPVGYKLEDDHIVVDEGCTHSIVNHSAKAPSCSEIGWEAYETCSKCDYTTYKEIAAINHKNKVAHSQQDATCTVNGYTAGEYCPDCEKWISGHEVISAPGHKYTSTVTKSATCTEAGVETFTCTCGDSYTETIAKLGHNYSSSYTVDKAATCTTAGSKSKHCSRCSATTSVTAIPATGHSYGSYKTTKAATCTSNGSKQRTCSVCKNVETSSIAKLGHSYSSSYTVDKAATCTTAGSKSKHCSRCSATTSVTAIPATGHSYGSYKTVKAATCTANGSKQRTCSACGNAETVSIAKLGHNYKTTTTKATLTKNGKVVVKCTVCGSVKSNTKIYYPKTIKLSATSYTYNGKVQTPSVTVKDSKGNVLKKDIDYTVKYESGRKATGTYTVTVKFKGNYEGTKKLTFTIAPKATSKISVTSTTSAIKLTWKKVTGADGYVIYQYNTKTKKYDKIKTIKSGTTVSYKIKKLKAGTKYKFLIKAYTKDDGTIWGKSATIQTATKTKTPTLKVTSTSKGKVALSWSNVAGESGYQVYYSTKKDSGYKKLGSYKANVVKGSKSKLTSGKKYYFKVRAYTKTDSGIVYSSWSSVKGVKVK